MILPINTYNDAVLKQKAAVIETMDDALTQLIDDMFETMYAANGVGLAAPQIGHSLRLFVIDADVMVEDDDPDADRKRIGPTAFINPVITHSSDQKVVMDEGCLSLPDLREAVTRPEKLTIEFYDASFEKRVLEADDWLARVIQHEFDHLEGILFYERLGSFKQRLLKSKLDAIASGEIQPDYSTAPKA